MHIIVHFYEQKKLMFRGIKKYCKTLDAVPYYAANLNFIKSVST